jgi:hypothetical protein
MNRKELLLLIDELLEKDPGTLKGPELLAPAQKQFFNIARAGNLSGAGLTRSVVIVRRPEDTGPSIPLDPVIPDDEVLSAAL